jgi:hypothetical protein
VVSNLADDLGANLARGLRVSGRRIVYADPPYLGTPGSRVSAASLYPEHPLSVWFDDPASHVDLMDRMDREYDAWALSLHEPSLRVLLPFAPEGVRVGVWVKPFASFKPGVDPAYTWEPVIYRTARKWSREQRTCRDHVSANITLKRGLTGAKPEAFCFWLFELLGASPDDGFTDLFPGSGAVGRAWEKWTAQGSLALTTSAKGGSE